MVDPAYGSSWYADTMVATRERGPLTYDLDVDLCVIGGGLAGLTVAYEVARRGWSVAVLESRRVAWNASGRNSGFVLPGFSQDAEAIVQRVGLDHARELWALSAAGVDYVRREIADNEMPGVDPVDGWLHVSKTDDERAHDAEVHLLRDRLGAEVEGWPVERVRAVLRSRHYFRAIHYPRGFHMHPLNYALGLAAAAERAGVRIFEQTPALAIDPAGVRKRIATRHARVRAEHVVLAGNVHLGGVDRKLSRTLTPIWTYLIATEPLGEGLRDAVAYRGAVSDTDLADNHYRIVGGDRLLWSGRSTTWRANPRRFTRRLVRDIRAVYPRLGRVKVTHVWSGVLGLTVHRMPQIGALSPGVWVASGFVGHGLNTTAMAGQLLGSAIVDNDDRWRLFLPFELIWAGGVAGRIFQQLGYWNHLRRERSSARRARRRDPRPRELPPLPADASEAVASTADAPKRVRRRRVTDAVSSAGGPADPEKRAPRARTTTSPSPSKATPSRVRQGGGTTDAPDTDTAPPVSIQPKAEPARRPVSRRRSEPMT